MSSSHHFMLLWAGLRHRPGRALAGAFAIALAGSVLLSAFAGIRRKTEQAPLAAASALAADEVHLAAEDPAHPYLDAAFVADVSRDPRVREVHTARLVRVIDLPGTAEHGLDVERFYALDGSNAGWPPQGRSNLWAWQGPPVGRLVAGRWPTPGRTDPIELVVPAYGLEDPQPRMPLGEWRSLESDTGVHRAVVVGAVDAGLLSEHSRRMPACFVDAAAATAMAGPAKAPSDARIRLHAGTDPVAFAADWRARATALLGHVAVWDRPALQAGHEHGFTMRTARSVAQTSLLLGAACVACIAFAVLGSSVRERSRQYRLLRTLGAHRGTLLLLVLAEAFVLALVALLGAVLLAWAMLAGLGAMLPWLSLSGAPPDLPSIALTFVTMLAGALAGSAWPALLAARSNVVDDRAAADPRRLASRANSCACHAVACLLIVAGLTCTGGAATRALLLTWVGVPGLALVALLLVPMSLRFAATVLLRPVAMLMRSDPLLLRDQFAGDEERAIGSVVAVAIGLGAFLLLLVWGASMLGAFVIDERVPRWLVSIHPHGLDRTETQRVLAQPELAGLQPLTLVDTRHESTDARHRDPEELSALVLGVDPQRAFAGQTALPLQFVAGDADAAVRDVATSASCLINDWFALSEGVGIGDCVRLVVPGALDAPGGGTATYRVAGIVDLHGWRMVFKHNKTRQRNFKQQLLVVLDAEVVRRDFGTAHTNYLLGDALPDTEYPQDVPLGEAFAVARIARERLERLVASQIDLHRQLGGRADAVTPVVVSSRAVMVDDLDRTRHVLRTDWGGNAVRKLGWLPLAALVLSLFPFAATLIASLRARARQIGVLRGCGLSRGGLLRLCIGESLLIGAAAVLVAGVFGVGGAWVLLEVATLVGYHLRFVGIQPTLVVPWQWFAPGWIVTLAVCVLAATWAGWRIGRRAPAELLAAEAGDPYA